MRSGSCSRASKVAVQLAATAGGCQGGEEERAGAAQEVVDEVAGAADVAAESADGLGEARRPGCSWLPVDSEMIDGAAAVAAKDTEGLALSTIMMAPYFWPALRACRPGRCRHR